MRNDCRLARVSFLREKQRMSAAPSVYRGRFSTRGRMTIPAALRRKFGLKGGTRVTFQVTRMGFALKPFRTREF